MSEEIAEIFTDFLNAVEAACVAAKREIAEVMGVDTKATVKEETFSCLNFEAQKGVKLGDYDTTNKKNSDPEKFQHAFNILKNSNATIANRYHGNGYVFSFWIYGDRIFRQKLKPKK